MTLMQLHKSIPKSSLGLIESLVLWQDILCSARRILIAYSGGIDSSVLLYLLSQLKKEYPQFALLPLYGVHVHHGLLPSADKWAKHCAEVCAKLAIPFQLIKVNVINEGKGESIEAAARKARYRSFLEMADDKDVWITAHQQNDQAETFLLRILRGSGISGLASIVEKMPFGKGTLIRPFLAISRADIRKYAEENKLTWIEDESNHDLRFARNFLRHKITPLLAEKWPAWDRVISRLVKHSLESNTLLEDLARYDLASVKKIAHGISISALSNLSFLRQKNVLRYLIKRLGFLAPEESQLEQVLHLIAARRDAMPLVAWDGVQVRRYKDILYIMPPLEFFDVEKTYAWAMDEPLFIPGVGTIYAEQIKRGVVEKANLRVLDSKKIKLPLIVRFRSGGEKICVSGRVGTHAVKKLFQEWNIPPWERARIPLIYDADNKLIAIANYAIAAEVATKEEGVFITLHKK